MQDLVVENLEDLKIPEQFNYNTVREVSVEIKLTAPNGSPISHIPVKVSYSYNGTLTELFKLYTDENGNGTITYPIPCYINELIISPNYIGIPNDLIVPILDKQASLVFDRTGHCSNSVFVPFISPGQSGIPLGKRSSLVYKFLSTYNSKGVPGNLQTRDTITSEMLSFINNSLPEQKSVPKFHPSYLENSANTDLDIREKADVWITFVHEGAGYTNSLAFYTYPTNSPPSSASEIDSLYIVFPNASYYNSGGGLYSGDKVKLGTFSAGTSIGFVCISNGWNGKTVGDGYNKLFSDPKLNTSSNSALKQQSVLLFDEKNKQFYIGIEDIKRDNSSCDNDFNDMVIYAKSNPVGAISNQDVAPVDNGKDSDNDGVSDVYDDFPNDAGLAYKNFYPSAKSFGTMGFEDCWPGKGDYDFNDLVIGYQFEQWLNAQNKVKQMKGRFTIKAIGAHYSHGFGFQMETSPGAIQQVSGYKLAGKSISLSSNGTENNQSKATIILFDNDYQLVNRPPGSLFNTVLEKPGYTSDTMTLDMVFGTALTPGSMGTMPYNPFIFIGDKRDMEVHLPGKEPTSLAKTSIFRTFHDNTIPAKGNYYKTLNNLPFAIEIPYSFEYPSERNSIHKGYFKFASWAQSGGIVWPDWYLNLSGYRDNKALYIK